MKIAIAGYAVEGRANYDYWSRQPDADITIVDQRELSPEEVPAGVPTITGPDAFQQLNGFDIVVRTASLPPRNIVTDGKIWSATNEFLATCPAPIIGVTGSKGKGTTCSLITSILEADGYKVWLVGNIGLASLEVIPEIKPEDIVVYELSSFQLWDVQRSPQTAVLLMIEPEHLDIHADMDDYVNAKGNITRHQSADDRLIYFAGNQYTEHIAATSQAQKIAFPDETSAHVLDGDFWYGEQKMCSVEALRIRGEHNRTNAIAAINAVWPLLRNSTSIETGLTSFSGLPHRLSYVTTVDDVEYYDDSIATTPASAVAALRAFPVETPKVIILGGSFKGSDFTELAVEMTRHDDITALLIGDEAARISTVFSEHGFTNFETLDDQTMPGIVRHAHDVAQSGGVVLLSPSAASFGLFKNYADRGDQFAAAVKAL